MKKLPPRSALRLPLLLAFLMTASCMDSGSTGPEIDPVEEWALAKGGEPGKPGGGDPGSGGDDGDDADPQVEGTNPSQATQDTTLDVEVLGDNFVPGSVAEFLLDEAPTADITTNATQFVNKKKLIANITVSAEALTDLYDVRVTTPPGRKGVGLELFEVTASTTTTFADRSDDNIVSDGAGSYTDHECGVLSDFNIQDARLAPDGRLTGKIRKSCADAPRTLTFKWGDPVTGVRSKPDRTDPIFMNIDQVETVTGVELRTGVFNVCGQLIFDPSQVPGTDLLEITFDSSLASWTVRTRPGADIGYCSGEDRFYHMPFELTIRRSP